VAIPTNLDLFFLTKTDPRADWDCHVSIVRYLWDKNVVSNITLILIGYHKRFMFLKAFLARWQPRSMHVHMLISIFIVFFFFFFRCVVPGALGPATCMDLFKSTRVFVVSEYTFSS
jgi:hypothetical protein